MWQSRDYPTETAALTRSLPTKKKNLDSQHRPQSPNCETHSYYEIGSGCQSVLFGRLYSFKSGYTNVSRTCVKRAERGIVRVDSSEELPNLLFSARLWGISLKRDDKEEVDDFATA